MPNISLYLSPSVLLSVYSLLLFVVLAAFDISFLYAGILLLTHTQTHPPPTLSTITTTTSKKKMKKKEKEAGMNDYLNTRVHTNTHTHRLRTTQALHKKRKKNVIT